MKILFIEPPKDFWFIMGEYLPPPTAILQLAAYLEVRRPQDEISVLDCQAELIEWDGMEKRIISYDPDIVAVSSLATCNTYTVIRALDTAKKVNPDIFTVTGGQHFTALADETLKEYPIIDAIVRGEGEETLVELVTKLETGQSLAGIQGLSFRHGEGVIHNPKRPLIEDINTLPKPGYHFVEAHMKRYHFKMMAGDRVYAIVEGSRGCDHHCTFCSQCSFWEYRWRTKTGKRIADEFEYCKENFGAEFLWLTDDNFTFSPRTSEFFNELNSRNLGDELQWFVQARADDVVEYSHMIPEMKRSGNNWVLMGIESGSPETLEAFKKGIKPGQAHKAMRVLKQNGIFAQGTFIIGNRKDTHKSIKGLQYFIDELDPDLAIFMILTPYPGTPLYTEAERNGWIEDRNWANYDMIHAIMPTETLTTRQVQEELYGCYRHFYGSITRNLRGYFSSNPIKKKTYRYVANKTLLRQLKAMI